MKITDTIYLDYNATTPVDKRVSESTQPYFDHLFGNASSNYDLAQKAESAIHGAKQHISRLIDSDSEEIFFTSGSTESLNFALKGLALNPSNKKKHIITSPTEHMAVLATCEYLSSIGFEIEYLSLDSNGQIDINDLASRIRHDTLLICLMWINNETGVIYPIEEIAKLANESGVYFVCDATQGVGKIPIRVSQINIDILCFSGHKMYAPKGIGAVYLNKKVIKEKALLPLIHGGGQQNGLRSGTYNVPLIVALGKACEIAHEEMTVDKVHIGKLQAYLEGKISQITGVKINGISENRIYTTSNITIPNFDAEIFMGMNKDIAVSNGSSCNSSLIQPSHVLLALGLSNQEAMSSIRVSLGRGSEISDVDIFIDRISTFINL